MWYNPIMSAVLRSPMHALLGDTMLLTVIGRKSGKPYTTPVGYYAECDALWIMSSRERTWWRNVCGGACVSMHLHGRDVEGFAEVVTDEAAVAARLADYVRCIPMAARGLGIRLEQGVPNAEDVARLAKEKLFVRIRRGGLRSDSR